ncbi:G-protein coupled receptor 139 [Biomphalaria glabrata]|uniref:G-protein coupled receptor dmsr-1-like n=2 Tax=Biomphalaria TaxID=6525 RepID=A0A2C9JGK9_BIOGL|nr:G-protein coupled receptor dmsr-1-like [Biomphalaria glabrata]KAI8731767.1 putative G-protein coupled receptor 139 [Biomphalaria glabrata]KAI8795685.1 G-protein coupled receptor 139 [Biomphalaria glabrata]KAK0061204.1 G-protein coupled receptor 139 [Biomphalaria pfeifferi]
MAMFQNGESNYSIVGATTSISPTTFSYGNSTFDYIEEPEGALKRLFDAYHPIHGYLAPVICVLGIIANCLNIVVLTRKNMISPTNVLLTWLAISDGLTMMAYLPFVILNYHIYKGEPSPLSNARFIMFFAIFSVVVHSISIWLTVSLAVFRYVFIRYPRRGAKLCSTYRAKLTVFIVCVVVTMVCIPNSVSYEFKNSGSGNTTSWFIEIKSDTPGFQFLKNFNLWIQGILLKLLPCLLLAILSILLIKQMKDAEKRRKKLMNKNSSKLEDDSRRHRKTNRTTRMLVVVVVLFVLTETPQGILQLLGGIIESFFMKVYSPLGDILDILALFNNGINFVLYCTMSKQFRDTFIKIFLSDIVKATSIRSETQLMTARTTRVSEV